MQRDDSTDKFTPVRETGRQTDRETDKERQTERGRFITWNWLTRLGGWLSKSPIFRAGQQMENSQAVADTSVHMWNPGFVLRPSVDQMQPSKEIMRALTLLL